MTGYLWNLGERITSRKYNFGSLHWEKFCSIINSERYWTGRDTDTEYLSVFSLTVGKYGPENIPNTAISIIPEKNNGVK